MFRLVVSDIDGTLLPYGRERLDPAVFAMIRRLRARGALFCPASGRQFHSLRRLFQPVENDVLWMCENGAILYGKGPEEQAPILHRTPIPRADALALCREILALPGCQVLISGANISYLCACTPEYADYIRTAKGNRAAVCQSPEDIAEEILKVSAYCPQGTAPYERELRPRWAEKLTVAVAGPDWLDFTAANKGIGLAALCRALDIPPEETLAFGDNWNDTGMLDRAGLAYLMSGSDPTLLSRYPNHCADVLSVLEANMETWFPGEDR